MNVRKANELFPALARAIYLAAGLVVLLWFLRRIMGVLLFFMLALILAIAVNAPVTWLERRRVHRTLATILVSSGGLVVVGLLGWYLVPRLVEEITILVNALPQYVNLLLDRAARFFGDYPAIEQQLAAERGAMGQLVGWLLGVVEGIWRYSLSILVILILGLVLVSVVLFMVLNPRPLLALYVSALPPHLRDPATRAFSRSSQMVVGWVYSSVLISGMKAVPAYFVLSYLGIPAALFWSFFTFFADLVPRLGFYLMLVPPVLVALAIDPRIALWVALYYWAISEILGNFVAPRIQSATMALHPVFLLFVTLALISAFGLLGALIATPVAGFIWAYYSEFYLSRMPPDLQGGERVEAMLSRAPWPEPGVEPLPASEPEPLPASEPEPADASEAAPAGRRRRLP